MNLILLLFFLAVMPYPFNHPLIQAIGNYSYWLYPDVQKALVWVDHESLSEAFGGQDWAIKAEELDPDNPPQAPYGFREWARFTR